MSVSGPGRTPIYVTEKRQHEHFGLIEELEEEKEILEEENSDLRKRLKVAEDTIVSLKEQLETNLLLHNKSDENLILFTGLDEQN